MEWPTYVTKSGNHCVLLRLNKLSSAQNWELLCKEAKLVTKQK